MSTTASPASVQKHLHETEPHEYILLKSPKLPSRIVGRRMRDIGFCINSPGAGGYCDKNMLWIADEVNDPRRVVEFVVHECLHAIYPRESEQKVGRYAKQIAGVIADVFEAKGDGLPSLRKLLTDQVAQEMFPNGKPRGVW